MDDYVRVRQMRFKEMLSVREIERRTGFHRKTIRKMLVEGSPPGYQRQESPVRPKLGPYVGVIDQILRSDRSMPVKQRHTAQRVFERLREEYGYSGGYTQVKEYIHQARNRWEKEAYVPLAFAPGTGQVDWGEATVWHEGRVRKAWLFVMTLPWSDARFAAAFPRGTAEFFYEGHRLAFAHFGGVPRILMYDNLKTAVTQVLGGKRRKLNRTFRRFAEHYLFEPRFCNVARGNEKGHVEGGVKWTRLRFFVPRPTVDGWEAFNATLAQRVRATYAQRCRGHQATVAQRLEEERTHLLPTPLQTPLLFHPKPTTVSSICLVRFDTNAYSVPCRYAHHPVTLKPGLDWLEVIHQEVRIAQHRRCYEREKTLYEPWHYLPLIEQKPGSLDHAAPLKALKLDGCFDVLRDRLEAGQEESSEGTRAYIEVLRLLERHSIAELTRAVKRALAMGVSDAEAVRHLVLCPPDRIPGPLDLAGRPQLARYHFAPPPLVGYRVLVPGGVA